MGDNRVLEQVGKQLEKIVTVVRVLDYVQTAEILWSATCCLMKIKADRQATSAARSSELVDIFRGRIVDVSGLRNVMVEISGQ